MSAVDAFGLSFPLCLCVSVVDVRESARKSSRKSLGDAFASPVRCGLLASYFLLDFFAAFLPPFFAAFFVAIVSILPSIFDG